jgi:acyl-CoA thioester hydrolase
MGIVHHSNHIRYFEEARLSFMKSIDCDAARMEQDGIIIPNVDAYAKYITPVRFQDEMEIEVKLAKFTGVIMRYEYTVRLAKSGETASVGHTEHCFVNDKFKPMSLRRKFPEYFDRLKSNISPEE